MLLQGIFGWIVCAPTFSPLRSTSLARVPMGIGVLGLVALAVYISMKTRRALDEMRAAADAANGGAATVAVGAQPPSDKPTDAHIRLRSSGKSVPCL